MHDLGFIFLSTYYRWYQVTTDAKLNEVLVQAGQTLAERFNEQGGYLRSFIAEDSMFIDIMMNVGIIYYAARETGDRTLRDIAIRHCAHDAPGAGARRRIHGARRHLRCGDGRVPAADARSRATAAIPAGRAALPGRCTGSTRATNTAAIRASSKRRKRVRTTTSRTRRPTVFRRGISGAVGKPQAGGHIRRRDRRLGPVPPVPPGAGSDEGAPLLDDGTAHTALVVRETSGDKYSRWEGILKGGVYHVHKELGVNESVMWGEYFFVEALDQALRHMQRLTQIRRRRSDKNARRCAEFQLTRLLLRRGS